MYFQEMFLDFFVLVCFQLLFVSIYLCISLSGLGRILNR